MVKNFLRTRQTFQKVHSFFFRELQLITVLRLIHDSYISWSTRFVSLKECWGFSILNSGSFWLSLYFYSTKSMAYLTLKRSIPFKIKIIGKPHILLLPDLWLLSFNKKFQNSAISAWVGATQKLTWRRIFWT